MPVAEI